MSGAQLVFSKFKWLSAPTTSVQSAVTHHRDQNKMMAFLNNCMSWFSEKLMSAHHKIVCFCDATRCNQFKWLSFAKMIKYNSNFSYTFWLMPPIHKPFLSVPAAHTLLFLWYIYKLIIYKCIFFGCEPHILPTLIPKNLKFCEITLLVVWCLGMLCIMVLLMDWAL